jgi:predicted nucleic acid-binding protein
MPKVVSNTTPIISLLKISKIEILKDLYSEIIIPQAVFDEIEEGKNKAYYQDLSMIKWIRIDKITDSNSIKFFYDLDAGEAEAIVLAKETGAELLIIDEKPGRIYAKQAGLKITGIIGVLIKAKKDGFIKQVKPLLIELTKKDVWISDRLIVEVCNLIDE